MFYICRMHLQGAFSILKKRKYFSGIQASADVHVELFFVIMHITVISVVFLRLTGQRCNY